MQKGEKNYLCYGLQITARKTLVKTSCIGDIFSHDFLCTREGQGDECKFITLACIPCSKDDEIKCIFLLRPQLMLTTLQTIRSLLAPHIGIFLVNKLR